MGIEIVYDNLSTYKNKEFPKNRVQLDKLDDQEYSNIQGTFKIIINGKSVPNISYAKNADVNIGYWIEELANLFNSLKIKEKNEKKYIIFGCEQGDSAFRFVKKGSSFLFSVIDCPIMEGKEDLKWQDIRIDIVELGNAFEKFRQEFLQELSVKTPKMHEKWSKKFGY